jgi:hypothetical protein
MSGRSGGGTGQTTEGGDRCPLCAAMAAAEERFLFFFLHERYTSEVLLRRLAAGGFCERHMERILRETADQLSYAASYLLADEQLWLEQVGRALMAERAHASRVPGRLRRHPVPPGSEAEEVGCPLCAVRRDALGRELPAFAAALKRQEGRDAFAEHPEGLCRRHLQAVLEVVDPGTATWLLEDLGHRLDRLQEALRRDLAPGQGGAVVAQEGPSAWRQAFRHLFSGREEG